MGRLLRLAAQQPRIELLTDPATPLAQDAEAYSIEYGVPIDEAVRRLDLQWNVKETLRQLRDEVPTRFAGNWIEHTPDYRAVLAYTGDDAGLERVRSLARASGYPIRIEAHRLHSLDDILAAACDVSRRLGELIPTASLDVDIRSCDLIVTAPSAVPPKVVAELERTTDVPLKFAVGPSMGLDHTYGGKPLEILGIPDCTSGFTIRQTVLMGSRG